MNNKSNPFSLLYSMINLYSFAKVFCQMFEKTDTKFTDLFQASVTNIFIAFPHDILT